MKYIPVYVEDIKTHKREYKLHVPDKFLEKFRLYTTEESKLIMGKDAFSRMMRLLDIWTLHQAAKEEFEKEVQLLRAMEIKNRGFFEQENRMTEKEIAELREWAIKQASKYDRKYNKYNDARAWVNAQRYNAVVELCDREMTLKI